MVFKYLILGPCAMGVFSILGKLKSIESDLSSIEEISGSSAGSLIGLLIILDISIEDILEICLQIDVSILTKPNLKNVLSHFGFVGHEEIKKTIKTYWDSTFLELFEKTKKKFHISAYCVNKSSTEYFSVDSHPHMLVADAICMSISIPFIFSAFEYNDFHYIDGGTLEEIPGLAFLNKNPDEILVVKISNTYNNYEKITKVKLFIQLLLNQILNNRIEYKFEHCFNINLKNINIYNFGMTYEEKIKLFLNYK